MQERDWLNQGASTKTFQTLPVAFSYPQEILQGEVHEKQLQRGR